MSKQSDAYKGFVLDILDESRHRQIDFPAMATSMILILGYIAHETHVDKAKCSADEMTKGTLRMMNALALKVREEPMAFAATVHELVKYMHVSKDVKFGG